MLAQMREGWNYVSGTRALRSILVLFALVSLMGYPYIVLMPVVAGQVMHGGAHTLGLLMTASGAGRAAPVGACTEFPLIVVHHHTTAEERDGRRVLSLQASASTVRFTRRP